MVKIVSKELLNTPGYTETQDQSVAIAQLENEVNEIIKEHPGATMVTWLQSGGSGKYGSFTQITVIVSW